MKKTKNENCRVMQDGGQFNPNPCIRRKFFIAYKNQSKREVQRRNKKIYFFLYLLIFTSNTVEACYK